MRNRRRMSRRASKRNFRKGARIHKKNRVANFRGGVRL